MAKTSYKGTSYASILSENGYPGYGEVFSSRVLYRMAMYGESMAIAIEMSR